MDLKPSNFEGRLELPAASAAQEVERAMVAVGHAANHSTTHGVFVPGQLPTRQLVQRTIANISV